MKKVSILGMLLACILLGCQEGTTTVNQAQVLEEILMNRHSVRRYSDREVTDETLLKVLWAANGVNREDGRRTAPSAINAQDIELYVCKGDGAYHYLPKEKQLEKVSDVDIRPFIANFNKFILDKPVILLVSDQTKFARIQGYRTDMFGAMDAGYVSQNIALYCVAAGLATVPCAPKMDIDAVREALKLPSTMLPLIYHPIGYPVTEVVSSR